MISSLWRRVTLKAQQPFFVPRLVSSWTRADAVTKTTTGPSGRPPAEPSAIWLCPCRCCRGGLQAKWIPVRRSEGPLLFAAGVCARRDDILAPLHIIRRASSAPGILFAMAGEEVKLSRLLTAGNLAALIRRSTLRRSLSIISSRQPHQVRGWRRLQPRTGVQSCVFAQECRQLQRLQMGGEQDLWRRSLPPLRPTDPSRSARCRRHLRLGQIRIDVMPGAAAAARSGTAPDASRHQSQWLCSRYVWVSSDGGDQALSGVMVNA